MDRGELSRLDADRSEVIGAAAKRGRDMHAEPRAVVCKAKLLMQNVKAVALVTAKAGVAKLSGAIPPDVPELDRQAQRAKRVLQAPPPPIHAHVPERAPGGWRCCLCDLRRADLSLLQKGECLGAEAAAASAEPWRAGAAALRDRGLTRGHF